MSGGYITYAVITLVYCKMWRNDIPWFNMNAFLNLSKYWAWMWGICIIPSLIDMYFQFRK